MRAKCTIRLGSMRAYVGGSPKAILISGRIKNKKIKMNTAEATTTVSRLLCCFSQTAIRSEMGTACRLDMMAPLKTDFSSTGIRAAADPPAGAGTSRRVTDACANAFRRAFRKPNGRPQQRVPPLSTGMFLR